MIYISLSLLLFYFLLFNYSLDSYVSAAFLFSLSLYFSLSFYLLERETYLHTEIFYLHFDYSKLHLLYIDRRAYLSSRSQSSEFLAHIYFSPMHLSTFTAIAHASFSTAISHFFRLLLLLFYFCYFFFSVRSGSVLECRLQCARGLFRTRPRRGKCHPWRPPSAHPGPRTLRPL